MMKEDDIPAYFKKRPLSEPPIKRQQTINELTSQKIKTEWQPAFTEKYQRPIRYLRKNPTGENYQRQVAELRKSIDSFFIFDTNQVLAVEEPTNQLFSPNFMIKSLKSEINK
ncbi:hypothetical protein JOC59_000448 [Weissella beninensis]|nr:hypothetical protein [Periweissella beninensis]MBM7543748.1 hypothetical protein [Periweissella beninensis]